MAMMSAPGMSVFFTYLALPRRPKRSHTGRAVVLRAG